MERSSVFLDSSVLIAAVLSSSGGSFYILTKLHSKFKLQINEFVLEEIMRVLGEKFPTKKELKSRLFLLIGSAQVKVLSNPAKQEVIRLTKYIEKEDAPILASALQYSSFLITLDNDFLAHTVLEIAKLKGLVIMKPKDFIEKFIN